MAKKMELTAIMNYVFPSKRKIEIGEKIELGSFCYNDLKILAIDKENSTVSVNRLGIIRIIGSDEKGFDKLKNKLRCLVINKKYKNYLDEYNELDDDIKDELCFADFINCEAMFK